MNHGHSYLNELGAILRDVPDQYMFIRCGGVAMVQYAYAHGYANRLWNRTAAVLVLFRANMERQQSYGHGNKAAKREALARLPVNAPSEQDVDAMAELHSEGRTYRRELVNIHA